MNKLQHQWHDVTSPPLAQAQLSEVALAVCVNGVSQSVMMVSDNNLEDFALGFALSEGVIASPSEVLDIVIKSLPQGKQVDLQVQARTQHRLKQRRRTMAGPSGCGLCGLESLDDAMRLPPGCVAAYYPETNPLVPLESVGEDCGTPTYKSIAVTIEKTG